jgi:nucleotide-binding universal stress UspA family protein
MADDFDSQVTALYAVTSSGTRYPYVLEAEHAVGPLMLQFDRERRERARAAFDAAVRKQPRLHWADAGDKAAQSFVRHALCHDLLLLAQRDPDDPACDDVPADFVATSIIDSGRPALVVPYVGAALPIGRRVLVAWKETREAARAVSAALPWLRRADQVHVAAWRSQARPGPGVLADLQSYLRLHRVTAQAHEYVGDDLDAGNRLLSLAADTGADLLVMGCYGHSRARERVLGGATLDALRSMTLPVLMAH